MNTTELILSIIGMAIGVFGGYFIGAITLAYNFRKRLIEVGIDKETLNFILSGEKP